MLFHRTIAAFSNNAGSVNIKQSAMLPAESLFEIFGQRREHGSTIVTFDLTFEQRTSVFGIQRLTAHYLIAYPSRSYSGTERRKLSSQTVDGAAAPRGPNGR